MEQPKGLPLPRRQSVSQKCPKKESQKSVQKSSQKKECRKTTCKSPPLPSSQSESQSLGLLEEKLL